ncbi:MAG TPA: hypothetical protein VKA84_02620 [Gemmatimonadaceae bacterium]|nr:hypothetical protein [Gemmatimonadaceae bacterium]
MTRLPFWWLNTGYDYEDWQWLLYDNGQQLAAPYVLPLALACRTCARLPIDERVLPIECPPELRGRPELSPRRGYEHRVRRAEFDQLRAELEPSLAGQIDPALLPLRPGDRFEPLVVRVFGPLQGDVMLLGILTRLVSERVHDAWRALGATGAVFGRVRLELVSRREMQTALSEHDSHRAEVRQLWKGSDPATLGACYHMFVDAVSNGPPVGVDPAALCPECGELRPGADVSARRVVLEPRMVSGADVLRLRTTGYIAVSDRVKDVLEAMGASGVRFSPADEEP